MWEPVPQSSSSWGKKKAVSETPALQLRYEENEGDSMLDVAW